MITSEIFAKATVNGGGWDDYQLTRSMWVTFGTCGMTLHKNVGRKQYDKYVGEWKCKTLEQINRELDEQEWNIN